MVRMGGIIEDVIFVTIIKRRCNFSICLKGSCKIGRGESVLFVYLKCGVKLMIKGCVFPPLFVLGGFKLLSSQKLAERMRLFLTREIAEREPNSEPVSLSSWTYLYSKA